METITRAGAAAPQETVDRLARVFKALGDVNRLRIVQMIVSEGETCVQDFTNVLDLSQSTISHHLKQLVEAGLLERQQRGTWSFYSLSDATAETVRHYLRSVFHTPHFGGQK